MDSLSSLPSNPYHIARAYGLGVGQGPTPPGLSGPTKGGRPAFTPDLKEPLAGAQGSVFAGPLVRLGVPARQSVAGANPSIDRIVAARVPGGIDFTPPSGPVPKFAAMQMYRHPADKHAAATALSVGLQLDVNG